MPSRSRAVIPAQAGKRSREAASFELAAIQRRSTQSHWVSACAGTTKHA
jgi:hypothetical protein